MKDTIVALKSEVNELCTALCTIMFSATEEQQLVEQCPPNSAGSNSNSQLWTEVVRWGKGRLNREQQRSGIIIVMGTNELLHKKQIKTIRKMEHNILHVWLVMLTLSSWSKKKVWGTHKSATIGEVKGVISILASIPADDLVVKRKFKVASGNKRAARWWFVLRAEETWSTIALPWRWKLEPLFCYTETCRWRATPTATPDTNPESRGDPSVTVGPNATSGIYDSSGATDLRV